MVFNISISIKEEFAVMNNLKTKPAPRLKTMAERKGKQVFFYALPGLLFIFLFCYFPLWGWSFAFVEYRPGRALFDSDFVGFKNFTVLFSNPVMRKNLLNSLRNTLGIHFLSYLFMPLPMLFAIFLSELNCKWFKKIVQTVSTLPHFISWVIMFAMASSLLASDGIINKLLLELGWINEPTNVLQSDKNVWLIQVLLQRWKNVGWNAIVYFAAIAGIDQEMTEAAMIDGASRMQRIWHITIPHLIPTFFVLLIINTGKMLTTGIDQYFVFGNALNKEFIETFDLYIYNLGIGAGKISYGVAVSTMKSVISLALFGTANWLSKKVRGTGIA